MPCLPICRLARAATGAALACALCAPARAADHADTPLLIEQERTDARISDLWTFVHPEHGRANLVLALAVHPFLPAGTTRYEFPDDVVYRFHIDLDSEVIHDGSDQSRGLGGVIVHPRRVREDLTLEVSFPDGRARLRAKGVSRARARAIERATERFTGPRADSFIFASLARSNTAAIVLELPLALLHARQDTLLIWATTEVDDFSGTIRDHAGHAGRSQSPAFNEPAQIGARPNLNTLHPSDHTRVYGIPPDVVILDTSRASGFPNGRRMEDDVVDQISALPGIYADDFLVNFENRDCPAPGVCPVDAPAELADYPRSLNSEDFPYLPPPHREGP